MPLNFHTLIWVLRLLTRRDVHVQLGRLARKSLKFLTQTQGVSNGGFGAQRLQLPLSFFFKTRRTLKSGLMVTREPASIRLLLLLLLCLLPQTAAR